MPAASGRANVALAGRIEAEHGPARPSVADVALGLDMAPAPTKPASDLVGGCPGAEAAQGAVGGTAFLRGKQLGHVVAEAEDPLAVLTYHTSMMAKTSTSTLNSPGTLRTRFMRALRHLAQTPYFSFP